MAIYSNVGARALSGAWFYLWYALDAPTGRVVDVFVDGMRKARLVCPPTGGWGDRVCDFDRASAFLGELEAGPHVVRLAAPNGGQAINLDGFSFSDIEPEGFAGDRDGDGLSDRQEATLGTSMEAVDSDGDGISDGDELQSGRYDCVTDPLTPDCDRDGMNDLQEAIAGTDPWDSHSLFALGQLRWLGGNQFSLQWAVCSGRAYRLFYADGLISNAISFREIDDPSRIIVDGATAYYQESNTVPARVYRLSVRHQP